MTNSAFLSAIGEMIVAAAITDPEITEENIRSMHAENKGAETLRLIVRDNLGGARNVIAAALWDKL